MKIPCPHCEEELDVTGLDAGTEIPCARCSQLFAVPVPDETSADDQDPDAASKVLEKMIDILTTGEEVTYVGVQKKQVVALAPLDSIVLTNKRFIIARPKLTGFKFWDVLWREVKDVHLSEQILGATISCETVDGQIEKIDHLPKRQARRIYTYAQEIEERMIEARRELELEERRAGASGVVVQAPPVASEASADGDPVGVLAKLKKMLDADLISEDEYNAKKSEILARM